MTSAVLRNSAGNVHVQFVTGSLIRVCDNAIQYDTVHPEPNRKRKSFKFIPPPKNTGNSSLVRFNRTFVVVVFKLHAIDRCFSHNVIENDYEYFVGRE